MHTPEEKMIDFALDFFATRAFTMGGQSRRSIVEPIYVESAANGWLNVTYYFRLSREP
jgi:proteasome assembly chaperone (PAC2) family protein